MAALVGKDYREIIGRPCWEVVHGASGPVDDCPHEAMKKSGRRETLQIQLGNRWLDVAADPIFNSEGNLIGAVHIMSDITGRRRAEEAQRRSEEIIESQKRFVESLIQNSTVATFVLDAGHRVLLWNKACEELTGVPASAVIGTTDQWKPFYSCERPVLADIVLDGNTEKMSSLYSEFSKSALTPDGLRAERWFTSLNNRDRYIVFDAAPIRDISGNIIAVIETLQDFTDRKKLEDQIYLAKQDWEETFNTITDMVTVHDKDFNIIRANKAAEKILGLSFLEISKTKCFQHYHGMSCPPEGCPSCQTLITGKPSTSELFEPHLNRFIEIRAIPRVNSNGQIEGLIHVVRDISERKRAHDALERYGKQLTALNTASNTLLASTNLKDIYQEICNIIYSVFEVKMVWLGIIEEGNYEVKPVAHAGREHGYLSVIKVTWDEHSPTGKGPSGTAIRTRKPSVISINDPSFAPWRTEARKRGYASRMAVPLLSTSGNCIGVLNFYGKEGAFTPDSVKLTQIFANQAAVAIENARLIEGLEEKVLERTKEIEDTNIELQSVNHELELRREEAEAGSRSKSDFLANMSHELRTPLNAVIGLSQVLLEQTFGPLNAKQSEYLDGVRQSGNHLLSLINDILDLSKIEAGKEQFEPAIFSMPETLRNAFMLVKEKAMKHGIALSQELGSEVGLFYADERRVKQVLFNLLSNAVKFTEPGGKVGLKARQDAQTLILTVWDTGIGIPESKRHLIFQPFQQLDSSLSRKHEGTGLGLVLSKRLVEMHGGTISFEAREGGGTSFTVTLPVTGETKTMAPHGLERAGAAHQSPDAQAGGKKIMLVEDNQLNMLLVADFLKTKGFAVVEATSGELALEKAARERPDIILLDIQMPGIDGFEVLRKLREDPGLKDIPVIVMTALAMKGDEERCRLAGADDYISKPVNLKEMLNKITGVL
jgi:PAS domain S-box-containing protein